MSSQKYVVKGSGRDGKNLMKIIGAVNNGIAYNAAAPLSSIMGGESALTGADQQFQSGMSFAQKTACANAVEMVGKNFASAAAKLGDMMKLSGLESFSQQLEAGAVDRQKAATIELNARSNRQWVAAEKLFPTLILGYSDEALILPVDVAGVGAYNLGGNSNEAFEDLRPIASVLRDSKFNPGDDLRLVPVLPADAQDPNFDKFVTSAMFTPWTHTYGSQDLLNRGSHQTNYLAIKKINNLMSLCQAPGAPKFDQTDEIEPGSIAMESVLFGLKSKDATTVTYVTLDTRTMSGNAMRPSTGVTSDDKRQMNFVMNSLNVKLLKQKTGAPTTAFDSLLAAGVEVFVQFEISGTYHKSQRSWSPTTSAVTISYLMKDGVKMVPGTPSMPADIQALVDAQVLEGEVVGILPYLNHNNVNRSRYGTTVVYATTNKPYNVHRRTPISVKYPMNGDDNNADVLAMLVKQMDVMVTRNMSHDAFKAAHQHFQYLYDNNGAQIVNINDDSSSILPGQHFLQTTAVDAKIDLVAEVSTLDSKDTRENIEAALVNKVYDVITALRVNSNIAALKEIDARPEEYDIIAHSSLAPFLMTGGDYRTFGQNIKFNIYETNIDSEIGSMWIVPKSHTTENQVDIFGGMGVCITKELLVIEGQVAQSDRQYNMIITQPAYGHHGLCPVAGRLTVTDIDKLLGDEGLISAVNKQLVKVSGKVEATGITAGAAGKEVEVEVGGSTGG